MSLEDRSAEINHDRPIWPQIVRAIEAEIATGSLAAGARLPTEAELAAQYGVGRNTVRRAIEDLRDRGLVETFHGRGNYVAGA